MQLESTPELRGLALEAQGEDVFLANGGLPVRRLFGGRVAAQAVIAAGRTLDMGEHRDLHSLHAYFLRPGRGGVPVHYAVQRTKEGRSFSARSVSAMQGEELIFSLHASFTRTEEGIAHQESDMPDAPDPDTLPESEMGPARRLREKGSSLSGEELRVLAGPVEMRMVGSDAAPATDSRRCAWIRPRRPLPDDPLLHAAALVWASDRSLLRTGSRLHAVGPGTRASLDHAMWLHRPPRFDGWMLFAMDSPVAHAARAWMRGSIYDRDGTLAASVVQEGLIRGRVRGASS